MALPNARVLVIDDDPWIVESTAMVLQADGLEVITAASGEDGIQRARECRPHVILLDIMMPGLDGWETLERLKTDDATRDTPVVIFSAREMNRGERGSRDRNADEYMRKPFEPKQLVEVVRKHVAALTLARKTA